MYVCIKKLLKDSIRCNKQVQARQLFGSSDNSFMKSSDTMNSLRLKKTSLLTRNEIYLAIFNFFLNCDATVTEFKDVLGKS